MTPFLESNMYFQVDIPKEAIQLYSQLLTELPQIDWDGEMEGRGGGENHLYQVSLNLEENKHGQEGMIQDEAQQLSCSL